MQKLSLLRARAAYSANLRLEEEGDDEREEHERLDEREAQNHRRLDAGGRTGAARIVDDRHHQLLDLRRGGGGSGLQPWLRFVGADDLVLGVGDPVKHVGRHDGAGVGDAGANQRHLERRGLHALLADGGEVGKRLDFLLQEMNRESNTVLSKTGGLGDVGLTITELALAAKSEIDKIREQSWNVE